MRLVVEFVVAAWPLELFDVDKRVRGFKAPPMLAWMITSSLPLRQGDLGLMLHPFQHQNLKAVAQKA